MYAFYPDKMPVKRYDDGGCGMVAAHDPAAWVEKMTAEALLAEVAAMDRMNKKAAVPRVYYALPMRGLA